MITRRHFLASAAAMLAARRAILAEPPSVLTVYKDPSCGCCANWVKHMSSNGFVATVRDVSNMDEIKRTMGVPSALQSCHTAVLGKYVFEGHVPADLVKKYVASNPATLGLAVPGMPAGSPGMEVGKIVDHYDVIEFDRNGKTKVFAKR
jgi:hypothetical protein